jgi:hypothetical protein
MPITVIGFKRNHSTAIRTGKRIRVTSPMILRRHVYLLVGIMHIGAALGLLFQVVLETATASTYAAPDKAIRTDSLMT